MLNDFGLALRPSNARVAPPTGTLAFAADAILEARRSGSQITPLPQHDLEACAKLLYSCMDTTVYSSLQRAMHKDHPEREILQIWSNLNSVPYKNFIKAAREKSYVDLKTHVAGFLSN